MAEMIDQREIKKINRTLIKLGGKAARRMGRKGINASMTPVLKEARRNTKSMQDTGALHRSLIKKRPKLLDKVTIFGIVGPDSDHVETDERGKRRRPIKYAHLLEFGAAPHDITISSGPFAGATVRHPGAKAKPWYRPAWQSKRNESLRKMVEKFRKEIPKEVAKAKA